METNENLLNNELQIDPTAFVNLKEAAMWARFLGIVGFVMSAILVLIAFFLGTYLSAILRSRPYGNMGGEASLGAGFITVLYLVIGAIAFLMSLLVYRFGNRTMNALLTSDQQSLNAGLGSLKIMFRVYGIITIIYLGIIVLSIIIGIIGALFMK